MVLQRDQVIPIWGWATPGEQVAVAIGDAKPVVAAADAQGRWRVNLPAMQAGGPHVLTVTATNTIQVKDILIGEVWVCIGQSNMQFKMSQCATYKQDITKANDPELRLCSALASPNTIPQTDLNIAWTSSNIGSVSGYSAVAYYFARNLREHLKVPVGIVHSSAGAIPIEAWTPASGCELVPSQHKIIRLVEQVRTDFRKQREAALEPWILQAKEAVAKEQPLPPLPNVSDAIVQRGWMQTTLYNSTIHPIIPLGIRGVVMYQGEANNGNGLEYVDKMKALIGGWRKAWGQGDFPFLYVQIAPWAKYPAGNLEGIWEAQRVSLAIPNTGMAVTTDLVPDLNDIHPNRKKEVGDRLALWARGTCYQDAKLTYSGPLFKSATIEGKQIRIQFDHVGSGLATRDGKDLDSFQIGNASGFFDALARIDGNSIIVSSDQVPAPEFVRFGWKNTANPNLINKEGLPASPFRTDCGPISFSTGTKFVNAKDVELNPNGVVGEIRYTLDDTLPTKASQLYINPVRIDKSVTISARIFTADGRTSLTYKQSFMKVDGAKLEGLTLAPGLDHEYYIGRWTTLPDYRALKPDRTSVIEGLYLPTYSESFMSAHRIRGFIDLPTDGKYKFFVKCHGGAQVMIDGKLVVDDEGFHAPVEKAGVEIELRAGKLPLTIVYHEGGGSPTISLMYSGPGIEKKLVPETAYFRVEPNPVK